MPYAKISTKLGIPVGSIGPSRRRCLDKIRRHPAITALINAETGIAEDELPGQKGAAGSRSPNGLRHATPSAAPGQPATQRFPKPRPYSADSRPAQR
jgi:hypothetical protein